MNARDLVIGTGVCVAALAWNAGGERNYTATRSVHSCGYEIRIAAIRLGWNEVCIELFVPATGPLWCSANKVFIWGKAVAELFCSTCLPFTLCSTRLPFMFEKNFR